MRAVHQTPSSHSVRCVCAVSLRLTLARRACRRAAWRELAAIHFACFAVGAMRGCCARGGGLICVDLFA